MRTIAKTGGRTIVYGPRWSRTGDALAFTASVRGVGWVTVASGRALGRVNTLAKGSEPDWSPIDNRLVVARPTGIFVLNRVGSVLRRVGSCEQLSLILCRAPKWSRDASHIAWLTGQGQSCELRATERGLRRGHMVAVGRELTGPLAWSRDGQTIFGVGSQVHLPPSM